jgi:hypothetical protein
MLPLPRNGPRLLERSAPSRASVLNTLFPFTPADNYTISNIIFKLCVEVKSNQEQAVKVQRVSRGIALLGRR